MGLRILRQTVLDFRLWMWYEPPSFTVKEANGMPMVDEMNEVNEMNE